MPRMVRESTRYAMRKARGRSPVAADAQFEQTQGREQRDDGTRVGELQVKMKAICGCGFMRGDTLPIFGAAIMSYQRHDFPRSSLTSGFPVSGHDETSRFHIAKG